MSKEHITDSIINRVVDKFKSRSSVGIKKYGVTLDRDDVSYYEWLVHLQEELMDGVNYIEKLKMIHELKEKDSNT